MTGTTDAGKTPKYSGSRIRLNEIALGLSDEDELLKSVDGVRIPVSIKRTRAYFRRVVTLGDDDEDGN